MFFCKDYGYLSLLKWLYKFVKEQTSICLVAALVHWYQANLNFVLRLIRSIPEAILWPPGSVFRLRWTDGQLLVAVTPLMSVVLPLIIWRAVRPFSLLVVGPKKSSLIFVAGLLVCLIFCTRPWYFVHMICVHQSKHLLP